MPVVELDEVSFRYEDGPLNGRPAVDQVSFTVEHGECLGIVGANGSGKSTLGQLMNGLLVPTAGEVRILGRATSDKTVRDGLWRQAGLLFQQPERQLFEATVFADVAYGLKNMRLPASEVNERAWRALELVGLAREGLAHRPPLALSGGERRRAAIAGVLAMGPPVLVLDEPTAGLDSEGRRIILHLVKRLLTERRTAIIMISHSLADLLELADKVILMDRGKLASWLTREHVLSGVQEDWPEAALPESLRVLRLLKRRGMSVDAGAVGREGALQELAKAAGKHTRIELAAAMGRQTAGNTGVGFEMKEG